MLHAVFHCPAPPASRMGEGKGAAGALFSRRAQLNVLSFIVLALMGLLCVLRSSIVDLSDQEWSRSMINVSHVKSLSSSSINETISTDDAAAMLHDLVVTTSEDHNNSLKACIDDFSIEQESMTFCRLTACDANGKRVRLEHFAGERCETDSTIPRQVSLFTAAEEKANAELGSNQWGFTYYPGSDPASLPDCKNWFLGSQENAADPWMNNYFKYRVPGLGIAKNIYYNTRRKAAKEEEENQHQQQPRALYIYAGATYDDYQETVSQFNLKQVRKAFGEDAFIIMVEATDRSSVQDFVDYVDVFIHADFSTPEMYYDSAAYQEGILEAYRLFGPELYGIDLVAFINDSLLGPLHLNIPKTWRSIKENAIFSVAVWKDTVTTGAGVVFNRAALDNPAFNNFWRYMRFPCGKWGSMKLWEGIIHDYWATYNIACFTSTNHIEHLAMADEWSALHIPYYKHRTKRDANTLSIVERYRQRVAQGDPASISLDIQPEDMYGISYDIQDAGHAGVFPCDIQRMKLHLIGY